jgi:hypothetical protein
MSRVANKDASKYIRRLEPFQGSNFVGCRVGEMYVAYSYGSHFPVCIYTDGVWLENSDKYSRSTSRHQSYARQAYDNATLMTTNELYHVIAWGGLVKSIAQRLAA